MACNLRLVACFLGFFLRLTVGRAQSDPPLKTLFSSDPPLKTLFSSDPLSKTLFSTDSPAQFLFSSDPPTQTLFPQLGGFENVNPTYVNGIELYEGDIMLSAEQRKQLFERKATTKVSARWTNGASGTPVVPYKFGDELVNTAAVEAGLAHWEEHTCIDFQEITGADPARYLNFIRSSGCWSYLGMLSKPQDISIGKGCTDLGSVVHEIGHAMGFLHEQSRSDRDDYVSIIFENIQDQKESAFQKAVDNNYSVQYDFVSDMHYGSNYFTVNGKNTITTKYPLAQGLIGTNNGLSHYDKLLANTMYPCISKWMETCNITTNPCKNDGYVGKDCQCVCRSGTSGTHCETVNQGYYDSLISSCSENVTAPGTVTSPHYPKNSPAGTKCVKWIQAPECNTVKIKFNYFRLYGKNAYCGANICCIDRLEIRTTNLTVGDVYCDNEIAVGTEFTSPSDQIILYFETKSDFYSGWSADVKFVPTASCYLKGSLTGVKQLPSMSSVSSFFNKDNGYMVKSCHQLINTVEVGTIGLISPPILANYPWERKACEIWIRSPVGTKITLTFTKMSTNTNVIVNKAGYISYPSNSTSHYSGPTIPAPITSTTNAMNVLLSSDPDNKDFIAFWSVIQS